LENRAARPVAYASWQPTAASYASRTMIYGGIIVGAFIIYHLLHYTALVNVGGANLADLSKFEYEYQGRQIHDIFKMLVVGFSNPLVALFYIVAVGLLSFHLSHGVEAMFQSLGLKSPSYNSAVRCFAAAISVFLFVGYSSIPVAILLGYGKEVLK
jgi:succinate dehydrogenase / fumarate reductase cytochrome b subunit